jgi:hypothetical protein
MVFNDALKYSKVFEYSFSCLNNQEQTMGSARKFVALALAACKTKQYEEAGIFLAQASQEEDVDKLVEELSVNEPEPISVESSDEDWGDQAEETVEGEDEDALDEESTSSVTRRKFTTLNHIGKVLASAMSLSDDDSEFDESDEGFEEDNSPDPDVEGESLIPASFSSVKVKSLAVSSPVKIKS